MNKAIFHTTFFILIAGASCVFAAVQSNEEQRTDSTESINLIVDTEQSVVKWRGTEMRGSDSHEGILKLREGHLELDGGQLTSGYFIADMHSITVTDIPKSDPVPRRYLTEHLESEDFFYVEKYPTAVFEITQTRKLEGERVRITGNLSVRDVTREVEFNAAKTSDKSGIRYNASFTIDRFEYNISYQGSYWKRLTSLIDNNFVDPDISISVELVALTMNN
ncbi:MAG: YceI family protein [Gracilimonas sp.]|uniref:YceI family protein n=1 Tax=Gracilimonas TaxID=649462 RepID=UPI001B19DE26|nr:YceI family protein [Gracilimonas sp.]MBO6586665.1 YceI family protein [Gracilimonas sp.]MBO6615322.1 YceI family protein [Gracilimonas sp.]